MGTYLVIFLLKIVTLIVLFITMYMFIDFLRTKNYEIKIKEGLKKANIKDFKQEIKNAQYISNKKKIHYIENLTLLIEESRIKTKLKFVNAIVVIIVSFFLAFTFFMIAKKYINILVPSVLIALIGYKIPSIVLNTMAAINSDETTKKLIDFINLLKNFCMIKNDIVFGISNSSDYLKEPLKNICEVFNYEVKHGFAPYEALENMKKKIDNNQYKLLIKNLQICSKHSNEFLKVLKNSEGLILRFSKEQNIRKKEIKRGVVGILMLVGISLIIFLLLTYINPNLIYKLKTSIFGKTIVSLIAFSYLVAILVVEKLSRFDF